MKVSISKDNKKGVGRNVSLAPVASCGKDVPCAKECYAMKAYRQYPATRKAWDNNLDMAINHRVEYFEGIIADLAKTKPRFFRWHVAGDILDQDYLNWMITIAREFPGIKFLAFTKRHDLDYTFTADNLSIIFSMWPGWGDTSKNMPRAWLFDGETRIPKDAIECMGRCDNCGMCWSLRDIGRDVVLHKH